MKFKRPRLTIWGIGLVCGIITHIGYQTTTEVLAYRDFESTSAEISSLLLSLGDAPPEQWDPSAWKEACVMLDTGFGNACNSPASTTTSSLKELRADLPNYLSRPRSSKLLYDIWDRISECSPAAFRYCIEKRALLTEALSP